MTADWWRRWSWPSSRAFARHEAASHPPSAASGLGIGHALVDECTCFAREGGHHTITLWTNSVLTAARRIYGAAGYRLVSEENHKSFSHDLVAETWELEL